MITFAIPNHIAEADVIAALDAKLSGGTSYLRGDDEDYLRVWYKDDTQVHLRVTATFGVETLTFKDVDGSTFIEELELVSTEQALMMAKAAQGVDVIQAIHTLTCLLALNSDAEVAADSFWSDVYHHENPAVDDGVGHAVGQKWPVHGACEKHLSHVGDPRPTSVFTHPRHPTPASKSPSVPANLAISLDPYTVDAHVLRARAFDGKLDS